MAFNDLEKQPLLGKVADRTTTTSPSSSSTSDSESRPTLSELQHNVFSAQRAYMKEWSRSTSGRVHQAIMFFVSTLIAAVFLFCLVLVGQVALSEDAAQPASPSRVKLEAHIMSKCPDARDCLHDMVLPAMVNVSDKVDFRLSYIGTVTDHDDGVLCLHGSEECLGNIIELCAARLYPDPKIYLGFTWCLTKNYQDIPKADLVEECALEHGISLSKIDTCAVQDDGSLSVEMLKTSFERSAKAGVNKSCTVRLNGKIRCIRDGGKWTDCEGGSSAEDLVHDILELTN